MNENNKNLGCNSLKRSVGLLETRLLGFLPSSTVSLDYSSSQSHFTFVLLMVNLWKVLISCYLLHKSTVGLNFDHQWNLVPVES